jgi:hypothetical protein
VKKIDEEKVRKAINYLNGVFHQEVVWDLWSAYQEATIRLAAHENKPRPDVSPFGPGVRMYSGALPSTIAGTGFYQGERSTGKIADPPAAIRNLLKVSDDENVIRAADFPKPTVAGGLLRKRDIESTPQEVLDAKARLEGLLDDGREADAVDTMVAEEGRRRLLEDDSNSPCRWHLLQEVEGDDLTAPCTIRMTGYVSLKGGHGALDLDLCDYHGKKTKRTFVRYA